MFRLVFSLQYFSITISIIFLVLPSSNGVDGKYKTCSSALFSCGNSISNVGYPFWGDGRPIFCGHPSLQLQCLNTEKGNITLLKIGPEDDTPYDVLEMSIYYHNISLKLGMQNTPCKSYDKDLNELLFKFSPNVENITFVYNCPRDIGLHNLRGPIPCYAVSTRYDAYYLYNVSARRQYASCSSFEVPVSQNQLEHYNQWENDGLSRVVSQGFEVNYDYSPECLECKKSSGVCGSSDSSDFVCLCQNGASGDVCPIKKSVFSPECLECKKSSGVCGSSDHSDFVCLCKNGASAEVCPTKKSVSIRLWGLIIFVGSASLAVVVIMLCCLRKRRSTPKFAVFWKSKAAKCPNVDAFLQIYGSFALTRHTYADIKQMTNSFRDKLGEGGFGTVYKGKLLSDRLVAVKVLKQTKGDGEDFLNEVATISRTNHVNIVTLLGFCFEGNKRALIYEFLPNGSLEKFMYHGVGVSVSNPSLPWRTLFNIATGIARGLNYLHRGCNARILHFDIKPHNILLDEEFRPKISDFGLARLCPLQESTISMLEARGTIGYIAPEVFCRTIGRVSHKSDVYSFGMMVIDMVCGRKNLSADLQRSSEVYFPEWIYDRLELEEETPFQGTSNGEEQAIQKKMIIVSLWCIQTYPSNRPSMSRVVDMLQGPIESIEMPPKLNLSSPPRSALDTLPLTETSD